MEARDGQVTPSHHCELLCLPHLGHVEELEVWPRGFFVREDVVVVLLPPLARSVVVENLLSAAHATGHLVLHSLLRDCIAWCGVENKDDTCQRWGLARAMVGVGQQGLDVEHKGHSCLVQCGSHDKQRTKNRSKYHGCVKQSETDYKQREVCVGATTNNAPRSASKSHG
jgi:hypothetical protein